MKKEIFVLVVGLLIISGCSNEENIGKENFEGLDYEMINCTDSQEVIDVEISDGIVVHHVFEANCCLRPVLSYKIKDSVLRIYEDFEGEECDCTCMKDILATLDEDVDEVEIYQRPSTDYPYELMFEKG